jgi:immune inhibitor A
MHFSRFKLSRTLFLGLLGLSSLIFLLAACQNSAPQDSNQSSDDQTVTPSPTQQPPAVPTPSSTPSSTTPPVSTPVVTVERLSGTATTVPLLSFAPPNTPTATPTQPAPTPTPVVAGTTSGGDSPLATETPVAPTPTPTPTSTPVVIPVATGPDIPTPPDRDLQDLGRRLEDYTEPKTVVVSEPFTVGQKVDFWVLRDNGYVEVSGEVMHISANAYWIFENGFLPDADDITEAADKFESDVWPAVTGVFGLPLTPGIDGDDRMVVYNTVLRSGVAGYFSAADSYPSEIRRNSNQREALYMSADRIDLTTTEYLSVIAHELQHSTHFASDSSEDSWINEGLSEIAAEIAGFARSAASAFVRAPSTSLVDWSQQIGVSAANYGASNLYFAFLASHYGGNDTLAAIARHPQDGIESVDSALAEQGFDVTADDVFADWLVANYLSTDEGPYSYENHSIPPVKNIYKRAPDALTGSVRAFGADYVVTTSGSGKMTVSFSGQPETSLLNMSPYSGNTCWWTNHGDSIDSTLTRTLDLRSVNSATLKYWVNYDIEEFWDYTYLMVSTDDGETWNIVDTSLAVGHDPNGNAYGAGLTGVSRGWLQDSADLSEYAGQQVLLRLEYITDDAVFSKGACFDEFEIAELDWSDDTSSVGDWVTNGFALVEETVPTQYLVQVIHEKQDGDPVVYQVPIGIDAKGGFTVENVGDDDLIVAVISAVTRQSAIPTSYTLVIEP